MAPSYVRSVATLAVAAVLLAAPPALAQAVPDITVTPASADLGTLSVPGGTDFEIAVRNDGVGDLVITDAFATDVTGDDPFNSLYDLEDFDLDLPYTLAPGETQRFGLTISPSVGRQDGSVTFESNDPDEPTVVAPITYFGTEIRFGPVMPAEIDFGTVSVAVNSFGDVTEAPTVCREVRVPTEGDEGGFAERATVDDDQFTVPALADEFDTVFVVDDTLSFDVCYTPDTVGAASATLDFDVGSLVNDFNVLGRTVSLTSEATTTNLPPVPQGIADGDVIEIPYDPATRTINGTIEFSFISPEAGQTTTISSFDFDSGDLLDEDDDVDADVRLTTTDGNPATGEIEVVLSPAVSVFGGDEFDVTLEACDDGPDDGECTTVTITIRLDVFPTRDCEPGEWYMFPFNVIDGQERVMVYASGPGPLDLSGCTFVAFNASSEEVTLAVDITQTLSPFEDRLLLEGGVDFPDGSLPDGPGAVAFIQGDVAVGDPVTSVLGRVAHAVVYFNNDEYFGVFPSGSPLDGNVRGGRRAGGAASLADALAAVRAGAGEEGPALAVGPNPTRGAGTVAFRLDAEADVRLAVYDMLGREVAVLADGTYSAGPHRAAFDAAAFPAGAYVVRLVAGGAAHTARVTVVR